MLNRHSHKGMLSALVGLALTFGTCLTARAQFRVAPITSIGETITCHVGNTSYELRPDHSLIASKSFTGKAAEAQEIFNKVTPHTKLRSNIYTIPVRDKRVNAEICPGAVNYIVYNADWLIDLYEETNSQWVIYAVIAHEIGHYVLGHDKTSVGSEPPLELEADEHAGEVLAKMGASLQEAQGAYRSRVMASLNSHTHPPVVDRLEAVKRGWERVVKARPSAPASSGATNRVRRPSAREIAIGSTGYIDGLEGRLNPILDSQKRTYIYADNIAIEGGKNQPVDFTPGQPFEVEDSLGNRFAIKVRPAGEGSFRIEYERLSSSEDKQRADLNVRVVDQNSQMVRGADVIAMFSDGTHRKGTTDSRGNARIEKLKRRVVSIYCAHENYTAFYKETHDAASDLVIDLKAERGKGSVVIISTGYVPGLDGRLNPILDSINRTYLYADGISIENGLKQPAAFRLNQPLRVEDRRGKKFELTVVAIRAATSLIEFARLN